MIFLILTWYRLLWLLLRIEWPRQINPFQILHKPRLVYREQEASVRTPAPTDCGELFWVLAGSTSLVIVLGFLIDGRCVNDRGPLKINFKISAGGVETLRLFNCIPSWSKLWHLLRGSGRVMCLVLGLWFSTSPGSGMAMSSKMTNQQHGNKMVWTFRGSDGTIVPMAEINNAVRLT